MGGTAVWIHGDLHPHNLLVHACRLSAVVDFGDLAAGDPATDLAVAWMLLPADARSTLRAAMAGTVGSDDGTWRRARGWALALGLAFLTNTRGDETIAEIGRATLRAVFDDGNQRTRSLGQRQGRTRASPRTKAQSTKADRVA